MALVALLLLLVAIVGTQAAFQAPVKHLAGPPSEFVHHRIPSPSSVEVLQRSASRNIWFDDSTESQLLASHSFPVESEKFVLSFASPVTNVRLELLNPAGQPAPCRIKQDTFHVDDDKDGEVPVTIFIVEDPSVGQYTLNVYKTSSVDRLNLQQVLESPRPDAVLTFVVDDELIIHSHLQSYLLKVGQQVGLAATVKASENLKRTHQSMGVSGGMMSVIMPDGTNMDVPMHDNGKFGGDLIANDKVFSASIITDQPGVYILESILDGKMDLLRESNDDAFERSAQHVIVVSAATVELAGKASLTPINSNTRVEISIAVNNVELEQPQLRAYTEVWGTSKKDGSMQPACWIGGLVEPKSGFVTLELDLHWLDLAEVTGPLSLHNTYVSDVSTSFPVSVFTSEISVARSSMLAHRRGLSSANITITKEMRYGVNPLKAPRALKDSENKPNLLLLPGYCADVNPWSRNPQDFTNGIFPVEKGNFANHEYANKIIAEVEAAGMDRFGIIAHSQGGMVAIHIHNYFWTGLEASEGERMIQTVGTPYKGSTAAGSAANLGKIFGVGCGSNPDLSLDGAANWITGIGLEPRKDVHFFTTTYKKNSGFLGDYCSLPMNLILQWPNDGVTEAKYSALDGANDAGNKEQWCHSTEMNYSAQYDDHERNAEMNRLASR